MFTPRKANVVTTRPTSAHQADTVPHPRWSQETERRIGEGGLFAKRHKTLLFNGYEAQVGQLYAGMDLKKNF